MSLNYLKDVHMILLDIIRFVVKQNLALRGHCEGMEDKDNTECNDSKNRRNFLEKVEFLFQYDHVLKEHLLRIIDVLGQLMEIENIATSQRLA